jgi:hypothetical protein
MIRITYSARTAAAQIQHNLALVQGVRTLATEP